MTVGYSHFAMPSRNEVLKEAATLCWNVHQLIQKEDKVIQITAIALVVLVVRCLDSINMTAEMSSAAAAAAIVAVAMTLAQHRVIAVAAFSTSAASGLLKSNKKNRVNQIDIYKRFNYIVVLFSFCLIDGDSPL